MNTRCRHFPSIPFAIPPALLLAAPLCAQAQSGSAAIDAGGSLLQVMASLVMVLALLFGTLYLLKKLSMPRGAANSLLRVVAGTAVGARERVVVVEVGETWLVLGVAPGQISALHQLPRQSIAPAAETETGAPGKDFAGWLKQVMERHNASS